jgi:hypothetical protein
MVRQTSMERIVVEEKQKAARGGNLLTLITDH